MFSVWPVGKSVRYVAASLIAVLGLLVFPDQVRSDDKAERAGKFIEALGERAVSALTEPGITYEVRATRFKGLLSDHFAINTIGQWVLGRYWKKATLEERKEYLDLFGDLLVVTYINRFQRYSGESVYVDKSLVDGKSGDVMVFSRVARPDGSGAVSVGWRVRAIGDTFKVVDVMVEGVSMGQTQRSEFASVIRQHGGEVRGLLTVMRERVEGKA